MQGGVSGQASLQEEQIWQSREPIELLPVEETLFGHFVDRVSPWVCLISPMNDLKTLQLTLNASR